MDELDVPMYWLRLPGLPAHYFQLVAKVAARLGKVVRVKTSWDKMVNGRSPTVCVQVPDDAPLPDSIPLKRHGARGLEEFNQPLSFADMMSKCDRCRRVGHTHCTCKWEPLKNNDQEEERRAAREQWQGRTAPTDEAEVERWNLL